MNAPYLPTAEGHDLRCRLERRDALVEAAITALTELRTYLDDPELTGCFRATAAVKDLRRPVMVEWLDKQRLARARASS